MKKLIVLVVFAFIMQNCLVFAQNVGINDDGSTPNNSAMLDVKSTSKGLLIPQIALMGVYDITTIPDPAVSLLVFNTTTGTGLTAGYYYWSGAFWTALTTAVADGSETKVTAGSNMTVTGTGTSGDPYVINTLVHSIGESYGGGIIFWLDASKQHGLIATTADQSPGIQWYNGTLISTDTKNYGIYAGKANTIKIVNTQGAGSYAAKICDELAVTVNGEFYDDWYLPSMDELNLLYLQKSIVGGFDNEYYWTSTENTSWSAWSRSFNNGSYCDCTKNTSFYVRAIRAF